MRTGSLDARFKSLVEWLEEQKLNWYLVLDVEIDPTNKVSIAAAKLQRLKELFADHMDSESRSITLDGAERFLLDAVTLDPLPMRYRLSKWAYLVVTDYPIKKLGSVPISY
jgi:hypothetical protein